MLGMLDKHWVQTAQLPEYLASKALDIEYCFINETGESPHPMTGGFKLAVTVCIYFPSHGFFSSHRNATRCQVRLDGNQVD